MVKLLNLSIVLYICVSTENQFKRHCPNLTSFSFSFYHDNHQQPIKISCLKIYNNKFPHVLFFELYMHRNYCFSRKQHSYAACDAALAAKMITSSWDDAWKLLDVFSEICINIHNRMIWRFKLITGKVSNLIFQAFTKLLAPLTDSILVEAAHQTSFSLFEG